MATTEIATIESGYPCLIANSRQARIIEANLDGETMREMDLIRVKTPLGGATTWQVDVDGNTSTTDELVGVPVAIGKRGYLWPSLDPNEQKPVLESRDLQVARRISDDLGTISPESLEKFRVGDRLYDWAAISTSAEFGFGSSKSGSKRVKELRLLALLRPGEVWPVIVTIGPGSLPAWMPFAKRLPCFHYEAVIGLRLTKAKGAGGQPYSQITPRLVGQLSEEQGEVARRLYTEPLSRMFSAYAGAAAAGGVEKSEGDDTPF